MSGHAIQRLVRQSPRKMRLVIDEIRGNVDPSLALARYVERRFQVALGRFSRRLPCLARES